MAGRLLDVNTLGALALAADIGALGMLLGVSRRPLALHSGLLGCFFALSLPVEHLAQRLLSHPLQLVAASFAQRILQPFFAELTRNGVLLNHPEVALAVDLPCSGARGLVLYSALSLAFATTRLLGARGAVALAAAVLGGAFFANVSRIVLLFCGSAHGLPMADEPWHSALGALCLGVGALPLLRVALRSPSRGSAFCEQSDESGKSERRAPSPALVLRWPAALLFTALGLGAATVPHHPIDRHVTERGRRLPTTLGELRGTDMPLRPIERRYFEAWGGFAEKRAYDDGQGPAHTALLVRTRSPLRHLHGPDRCLLGAGHRVERLGVLQRVGGTRVPTVLYRSTAPDGRVWRVAASFVSDRGETATSVSEVVWSWLGDPEATWSLVERISPWEACEVLPGRCHHFDCALFTSLDIAVAPERVSIAAAPVFASHPSSSKRIP
jgi:exosortase/archaeosortase family protein